MEEKNFIESYWVAVNGPEYECFEQIFHNKPIRANSGAKLWYDSKTNSEICRLAKNWIGDNDFSMILPQGTIEKLIGRKLTWKDEPVEIKIDLNNYGPKQNLDQNKSYLFETDGTIKEIQPKNSSDFTLQECYDLIGCELIETYNIGNKLLICDEEGNLKHKEFNYPITKYLFSLGFKNIPEFVGNCILIQSEQLK